MSADGPVTRTAHSDPALTARVVSRRPLMYRHGADRGLDRPAHVRAGSSLAWVNDRLVLVQDDANFLAIIDPATGLADAITLPAGAGGMRQFDDSRGNKKSKLDLEACCVVDAPDGPMFLAFGSGSSDRRRRIVVVDRWHEPAPRVAVVDAEALYATLEAATHFSGSELNIEGALALPDAVRLVSRGNGAPRAGLTPCNATCDLPLEALRAYLRDTTQPAPEPAGITQFVLGSIDGLSLGFTDVALSGNRVLYAATAEASPSATEDGRVSGSVIGVMPGSGVLRYAPMTDADGSVETHKVEGLAAVPGSVDRIFVVVDSDDAAHPSDLYEVRLDGPW